MAGTPAALGDARAGHDVQLVARHAVPHRRPSTAVRRARPALPGDPQVPHLTGQAQGGHGRPQGHLRYQYGPSSRPVPGTYYTTIVTVGTQRERSDFRGL